MTANSFYLLPNQQPYQRPKLSDREAVGKQTVGTLRAVRSSAWLGRIVAEALRQQPTEHLAVPNNDKTKNNFEYERQTERHV
jgi:hypothetical protein